TYPIIVHAVPSSFDIDNPEEVRSRIEPFNLNLCDHILKMNWCRTKKQTASSQEKVKTHSSLILVVDHSSTADALIEFGLVIDGKAYTVEKSIRDVLRCFKCQQPGHTAARCKAPVSCGVCAGPHFTKSCTL
ncbi:hypothetical protein BT69DRAFT_1208350, partial [Atractiella rhizophila]